MKETWERLLFRIRLEAYLLSHPVLIYCQGWHVISEKGLGTGNSVLPEIGISVVEMMRRLKVGPSAIELAIRRKNSEEG
jgi:hypothetical protein